MGEVETVDDLALTVTPANELELSRAVAVDRVFKGGVLATLGVVLYVLAGFAFMPPGFATWIAATAGIFIGGYGGLEAGRAASHLAQYGGERSSLPLLTTAGLGASLVTVGVTHAFLPFLGYEGWVEVIRNLASISTVGFATLLVLLVARTLLGWDYRPQKD